MEGWRALIEGGFAVSASIASVAERFTTRLQLDPLIASR